MAWRALLLLPALAGAAALAQTAQPMGRWSPKPADACRARPGGPGYCDGAGNWLVNAPGGQLVHTSAGKRFLVVPTIPMPPPAPPPMVESDAGRWSVKPGDPCLVQPLPPAATQSYCTGGGEWLAITRDGAVFVYRPDGTAVRQQREDRHG